MSGEQVKRGSRKREGRGWMQQRERGGRWNEGKASGGGGGKGVEVAEKAGESCEKRAKREGRMCVEQ